MVTYIYFVKCPNCEDEHFDFFDEAKEFALGCLSQKPIITQTEVCRNDFGECTDSCDLGTVWSWEDMMGDGGCTEAEPTKSIFTKDDLKPWIEDEDPEFDNLDNSVDCEIDKPVIEEDVKSDLLKYIAHIPKNVKPPHPVAKNGKCGGCGADLPAPNINGISKCTSCQGLYAGETFICCPSCGSPKIDPVQDFKCKSCGTTLSDLERGTCTKCGGALDSKLKCVSCGTVNKPSNTNISNNASTVRKPILEGLNINFEVPGFDYTIEDQFEDDGVKGYNLVYSKNGTDIVEVEVWEEDAPVMVNNNLYAPHLMSTSYDSFDSFAADLIYKTSKYIKESRKPIPEGMTIEQLVEEMEENEDTVECTWCEELFDKSECRKEVDLGWLCSRCEAAIKSRGETLTFKENNYWDFLDEEVEPTEKKTWLVFSGDNPIEVGEVYANTEEEAVAEAERKFPDLNYNDYDGAVQVVQADEELTETAELHDLGNEYDGGYPAETPEVSDSHLKLCPECGKETFDIETGICVECGFN